MLRVSRYLSLLASGQGKERTIMGNVAVAEVLVGTEGLDQLYELDAHDSEPEGMPAEAKPEGMPAEDKPAGMPAEDKPAGMPAEDKPAGMPAEDKPAGMPAEDEPEGMPAELSEG
jgi:hypothetical protein